MAKNFYQVFRANNEVEIYSIEKGIDADNVRRIMQYATDNFPGSEVVGGSLLEWSTPLNYVFWGTCETEPEDCMVFGVIGTVVGRTTVVAGDWGRAQQYVEYQGGTLQSLVTIEGLYKGDLSCKGE